MRVIPQSTEVLVGRCAFLVEFHFRRGRNRLVLGLATEDRNKKAVCLPL
jgi:hypothetical protein